MATPFLSDEGDVGHWGFINDYAGILKGNQSQEETTQMAQEVAVEVRTAFLTNGWEVHKETLGQDLTSLGIDFELIIRRIRGTPALF